MMLSDVCLTSVCLTSVCRVHIGPKSRTERPKKIKIGTKVAHVTRDSDHFQGQKVKGQGRQAALLTAALTHQAAAAVNVGTYWPWEPTATLMSALFRHGGLGGARRFNAHRGRSGAGAYCGCCPPTACYYYYYFYTLVSRIPS